MTIVAGLKLIIHKLLKNRVIKELFNDYYKKFLAYAFIEGDCISYDQYVAYITKMYHSVEKGLSHLNFRSGFGKGTITALVSTMDQYAALYGTSAFFYETSLSTLNEYVRYNRESNCEDVEIEARISKLPGHTNELGGVICFDPWNKDQVQSAGFKEFNENRHSIRHFSKKSVDIEILMAAITIAQHTPSACNRQGWKARIIENKDTIRIVLANQNGNKGFGEEIDKIIVVSSNLCYFNQDRELYQAFIDGGMYAMNILHSLHYEGVASIPLSASLTKTQEGNVRKAISMADSEVLIMFIGVGNYPDECKTTRSERRPAAIEVV